MVKPFNWKVFGIVWAAAMLSTLALLPYANDLQSRGGGSPVTPTAADWLAGGVQTAVFAGVGLLCASAVGLGLPILDGALRREPVGQKVRSMLPISILLGVAVAVLIIVLSQFVFQPLLVEDLGEQAAALTLSQTPIARWKAFLASFYGGIAEEVMLRLGVMSLLAWLGRFLFKTADNRPRLGVLWVANVLAAVYFGYGHLGTTALSVPLTPLVITWTILGNALGGVVFGWLYMKHGLESAMLSHFSADIVLHVVFQM